MIRIAFSFLIGFFFLIPLVAQVEPIISQLILLNVETGEEIVILEENRHFEAPNWSRDGKYIVFNSGGLIEKVTIEGKKLGAINTDFANKCNNDHGLSFDGEWLVISHNDERVKSKNGTSRIFILPIQGGMPKLITSLAPSYWHGISPDSQWVVYCAERNGEWDIYKAHVNTGEEVRLTDSQGLDDGPEYSYDGEYIYFNSHRTGRMHLYKMRTDGTEQTQLTLDDYDNWFPHPSPDNKSIAYISYLEDQNGQHPFGKDVRIRLLNKENLTVRDLTPVFYGGQGSLNVHSWSPDSKQIAFVRYVKPNI
ncbi:MAG: TolB family protein [Candidatus Saccharimonadaceae bacterium]